MQNEECRMQNRGDGGTESRTAATEPFTLEFD